MIRRIPLALAALPALGVAQLVPESGPGLALRLAAATVCVLLPGIVLARALRLPGAAPALALGFGVLFGALAVTFALQEELTLALLVLAGAGAAALPFALWRGLDRLVTRPTVVVAALGSLLGLALWYVAAPLDGDALFHLARVRKLEAFDSLSLDGVSEFADGGLHPGYAFPLWHGFLALVSRLAGVDPSAVAVHEASVLAPVAALVTYEAGATLFRSVWAGVAALIGHVTLVAFAPEHGGAYVSLALPATGSRQLLVPAVLALVFAFVAEGFRAAPAAIAAGGLALALVHPTYAVFLCIPLAGFLVARALLARADLGRIAVGLLALALPTGAVSLWLLPIVRDTVSHTPAGSELGRAFTQYAGQLDVFSEDSYRLAPELFGRAGAVAVAALVLLPLAVFASRRRWAAYVLGGSLAVFSLTLVQAVFPYFADLVSISQARRAAGFVPLAFAFAGGLAVLAYVLRHAVLPLALAAGIGLQIAFPGDFGYRLEDGGPAIATWIAVGGGAAALVVGALARGRFDGFERRNWLVPAAAALFVLPVAAEAATTWNPRPGGQFQLTPGLIQALRERVPPGDIVFSDLGTSYRISAFAPVYVAAAPPGHVADTRDNRPYERAGDSQEFFRTGDLSILRRYRARWLVVNERRSALRIPLEAVYIDERFALYRF